jgi:hypothetical protein
MATLTGQCSNCASGWCNMLREVLTTMRTGMVSFPHSMMELKSRVGVDPLGRMSGIKREEVDHIRNGSRGVSWLGEWWSGILACLVLQMRCLHSADGLLFCAPHHFWVKREIFGGQQFKIVVSLDGFVWVCSIFG